MKIRTRHRDRLLRKLQALSWTSIPGFFGGGSGAPMMTSQYSGGYTTGGSPDVVSSAGTSAAASAPPPGWVNTTAGAANAVGAVAQGVNAYRASKFNAGVMIAEQRAAGMEANTQENITRRNSAQALGRQTAAFGAAGVGYGGSSATALSQSAINQEMDALNTRYKGALTGLGYGLQSQLDTRSAQTQLAVGGLSAGAALLKMWPPAANYTNYQASGQ